MLRIPPHGHTGRCYGLDRGAPLGGRALLGFGIEPGDVKVLLKDNPARLMWLDERDAATVAPAAIAGIDRQEHKNKNERLRGTFFCSTNVNLRAFGGREETA
jgi:hypothetical protein